MGYFDYPFDSKLLLRKKRVLKKQLLEKQPAFLEKRIAILGGSTTDELKDQLELFLLNYGIKPAFYQSEYGKYYEDGMFGNDTLDAFSPDVIYFHTNWRNITRFPALSDTAEDIPSLLQEQYGRFEGLWNAVKSRYHCPIIQNSFDRPDYRLMGNRDIWDNHGRSNFIAELNQLLYKYARENEGFYINDLEYISATVGLQNWESSVYWHMYKYMCNLEAIPYIASSVANIIKSIFGKNKKLLAVDLDNTIWGGIVGDDGVEGLELGNETPKGEIFESIQSYLRDLKNIGVVLAIDSKNDKGNAIAGLNHPDSKLSEEDFVAIEANWEPKDTNLLKIADSISLGTDSFVFMDDNPAERDIVKQNVAGVAIPELDKPENFIGLIDRGGYFETTIISEEDSRKTLQYKSRAKAKAAESTFSDYGTYLDSLEMEADIGGFKDIYIQRIAQLTNKSNQFNLTTLRCTEDDIRSMSDSDRYICLYGRLQDKFGDNGVVAVTIGEIIGSDVHIRLWIMSCRVLKRGMEDAMMNTLLARAKEVGCDSVIGYYYPTAKNGMVKSFFGDYGFIPTETAEDGSTTWKLVIDDYQKKSLHMKVN